MDIKTFVIVLFNVLAVSADICPPKQYANDIAVCVDCTVCAETDKKVTLEPCTNISDTVCGSDSDNTVDVDDYYDDRSKNIISTAETTTNPPVEVLQDSLEEYYDDDYDFDESVGSLGRLGMPREDSRIGNDRESISSLGSMSSGRSFRSKNKMSEHQQNLSLLKATFLNSPLSGSGDKNGKHIKKDLSMLEGPSNLSDVDFAEVAPRTKFVLADTTIINDHNENETNKVPYDPKNVRIDDHQVKIGSTKFMVNNMEIDDNKSNQWVRHVSSSLINDTNVNKVVVQDETESPTTVEIRKILGNTTVMQTILDEKNPKQDEKNDVNDEADCDSDEDEDEEDADYNWDDEGEEDVLNEVTEIIDLNETTTEPFGSELDIGSIQDNLDELQAIEESENVMVYGDVDKKWFINQEDDEDKVFRTVEAPEDSDVDVDIIQDPFSSEWQMLVLLSALTTCFLFFIVVVAYICKNMKKWKQFKNTFNSDIEDLSVRINLMQNAGFEAADDSNNIENYLKILKGRREQLADRDAVP